MIATLIDFRRRRALVSVEPDEAMEWRFRHQQQASDPDRRNFVPLGGRVRRVAGQTEETASLGDGVHKPMRERLLGAADRPAWGP